MPLLMLLMAFSTQEVTSDYLVSGAYDWMMTCEQSQEAITNLYKDEYYSRPENVGIRESMKKKFLRHTPYECAVEI